MKIQITGVPSGDGECFCFIVTEQEYRKIVGEEIYAIEVKYRKELKDDPSIISSIVDERWMVYPSDLLIALGLKTTRTQVSLEISTL